MSDLGWWAISGEAFLAALRRAHAGEDPDALYVEHYANSDTEKPSARAASTSLTTKGPTMALNGDELARLERPCADCGCPLDDHGGIVNCWRCEDEGRECCRNFMALLAERVDEIARARLEAAVALGLKAGMAAGHFEASMRRVKATIDASPGALDRLRAEAAKLSARQDDSERSGQ